MSQKRLTVERGLQRRWNGAAHVESARATDSQLLIGHVRDAICRCIAKVALVSHRVVLRTKSSKQFLQFLTY